MGAIKERGVAAFRFHDLRHTHVAWLIAGGAPLPHIGPSRPRVDHPVLPPFDAWTVDADAAPAARRPVGRCSPTARPGNQSGQS
jgi:hypothetical protein